MTIELMTPPGTMKQILLEDMGNDFSNYLKLAQQEPIEIVRGGRPIAVLIAFDDPEDWWEELLLAHPKFLNQVAEARRALRAGEGITIESLRAEEITGTVALQSNITPDHH